MDEQTFKLSNSEILRLEVDEEHFYYGRELLGLDKGDPVYGDSKYYVGVTRVIDIGGPFPEGLREYLRINTFEEQKERLEFTGARGKKLHDALDRLAKAEELDLKEDYRSSYEKDAIVTFMQFFRFLAPGKFFTEMIVADPKLRLAGQMDFNGFVDKWKLVALLGRPTDKATYLEVDSEGALQLKEQYLDFPEKYPGRIRIVIDWKFTGRNAYSHKIQVAAYKRMNNISQPGRQASRAFTWRYSPKHKLRFDFSESLYGYKEFMWVYNTFITFVGEFPQPPVIRRYPDKVRLFDFNDKKNIIRLAE